MRSTLRLIIGGVKHFVNKDGDLVQDPSHVNEPDTPEEKAASDKVKQENGEEIAQQLKANGGSADAAAPGAPADAGSAATGERGMAASTGVTQMPAGVIALLILSVIGAAGYAFTRRQTV